MSNASESYTASQYRAEKRNDPRSTEELIRQALSIGDIDDHAYWEPVTTLWYRDTPETVEAAEKLCGSTSPTERELGANILGQLGAWQDSFHEERLHALLRLLESEADPDVLSAACISLGHLCDPRAIETLVRFKDHTNEDVRFGVVSGLGGLDDELSIRILAELSRDPDSDVRDWATFSLGTMRKDSPEISEALAARLADEDDDTRAEAIVGLARQKDERAVEPLIQFLNELDTDDDNWTYIAGLLYEAASELADPRICSALIRVKNISAKNEYLDAALQDCRCVTE